MQTNYYFLRKLSKELETKIQHFSLEICFSQEKDELVLGFANLEKKEDFYIKAVLHSDFACLAFPQDFKRAGKNSVNLFKELIGLKVISIQQFENERAFAIHFKKEYVLVFKMFGNRSNIILFHKNKLNELFHNKLIADKSIEIEKLNREIVQNEIAFIQAGENWKTLFPTFGKLSNFFTKTPNWEETQAFLNYLKNPTFTIVEEIGKPRLSLLNEEGNVFKSALEASNSFYLAYVGTNVFDKEKALILKSLEKQKEKSKAYIQKCNEQFFALTEAVSQDEIGHILMANLHQIPERVTSVELFDFYRDNQINIKLKADLSPQKNAENYYRKAKNQKIEIQKLSENINTKEEFIQEIEEKQLIIEKIETLRELRKYLKINLPEKAEKENQSSEELFKHFECEGFEILVGKNAKNNDLLTQRAKKDDLWLHARDVAGSHVIIKNQSGKNFPKTVIERAAGLAAFYSKRKNDSLCPVIVTPKKFVRKTKDLAAGQVIVEKEDVLMVVPKG